ncbi:D-lactonohydrolase-like protein-like protein [Biscogniauxia marginata]|nr:D-lactonohydrolase-like protein-like protein [Biscogniauxia marginata]
MSYTTRVDTRKFVAPVEIIGFGPGFKPDLRQVSDLPTRDVIRLRQYQSEFTTLSFGRNPTYSLLLTSADSSKNPFFHGSCAYFPAQDELFVTSDLLQPADSSKLPTILISRITLERQQSPASPDVHSLKWMKLRPPHSMTMPAGVIPYEQGLLYCSQGSLAPDTGGLWHMPLGKPPVPVLTQFYNKPFNSIQNVTRDKQGGLWFTDSDIGFELDIRPKPQLPNQVYRFDPKAGSLRVVADGFGRPTGIALSPDEDTLYITDMGAANPGRKTDPTRAGAIYAFDVVTRQGAPFLTNKRVFAMALVGTPKGLACDHAGNVYAACADGVEIWSPAGTVIGLIEMLGGCSNLCFGRQGELFICAEQRLWMIKLESPIDTTSSSSPNED